MTKTISKMDMDELFDYLKDELEQAEENIQNAEFDVALARTATDRLKEMIRELKREL